MQPSPNRETLRPDRPRRTYCMVPFSHRRDWRPGCRAYGPLRRRGPAIKPPVHSLGRYIRHHHSQLAGPEQGRLSAGSRRRSSIWPAGSRCTIPCRSCSDEALVIAGHLSDAVSAGEDALSFMTVGPNNAGLHANGLRTLRGYCRVFPVVQVEISFCRRVAGRRMARLLFVPRERGRASMHLAPPATRAG
jgi:hypothetical protein